MGLHGVRHDGSDLAAAAYRSTQRHVRRMSQRSVRGNKGGDRAQSGVTLSRDAPQSWAADTALTSSQPTQKKVS